MQKKLFCGLILVLLLALTLPTSLFASVAGHFTMVRGQVDLLKGGQLPAVAAKVKDAVAPGDIIRTKSKAKAQLTMVDDSIITLAPESRIAIADYKYNTASRERRAVLRIFRGLMQTVVKHIIKKEQPDFIVETHTATIGIRGSNPYFLLMPAFTSVYLPQGLLEVKSNVPTIPYQVTVHSMQFTQIPRGKQPLLPRALTPEMVGMLQQMMNTGVSTGKLYIGTGPAPSAKGGEFPAQLPVSPEQLIRLQTIPPTVVPKQQMPAPQPVTPHPSEGGRVYQGY